MWRRTTMPRLYGGALLAMCRIRPIRLTFLDRDHGCFYSTFCAAELRNLLVNMIRVQTGGWHGNGHVCALPGQALEVHEGHPPACNCGCEYCLLLKQLVVPNNFETTRLCIENNAHEHQSCRGLEHTLGDRHETTALVEND